MMTFNRYYRPLTSRPFLSDTTYQEYPPCEALRPYIACFWASESPGTGGEGQRAAGQPVLVIPDTCADIIIEINYTRQKISGRLCGIQDYPVFAGQKAGEEEIATFAVRFYFWAVCLFFQMEMREMVNQTLDLNLISPGGICEFTPLFELSGTPERIIWMENYLLGKLNEHAFNPNLYNSIDHIMKTCGRASVKEICEYSCVSQRQMERLFQREIGISIKRTASLVRYQNVWKDVVCQERFEVQEAVYRYGYSDQSHLLNEFKRFHGVTPEQAKRIAAQNR